MIRNNTASNNIILAGPGIDKLNASYQRLHRKHQTSPYNEPLLRERVKTNLANKFNQNEPNSHKQMANYRGVKPQQKTVQTNWPLDILTIQQFYGSILKLWSLHPNHTLINKTEARKSRKAKNDNTAHDVQVTLLITDSNWTVERSPTAAISRFASSLRTPECWQKMSKLTNQRVYQDLVYRNKLLLRMFTGVLSSARPTPLSFFSLAFPCAAPTIRTPATGYS